MYFCQPVIISHTKHIYTRNSRIHTRRTQFNLARIPEAARQNQPLQPAQERHLRGSHTAVPEVLEDGTGQVETEVLYLVAR